MKQRVTGKATLDSLLVSFLREQLKGRKDLFCLFQIFQSIILDRINSEPSIMVVEHIEEKCIELMAARKQREGTQEGAMTRYSFPRACSQ
jgi:hypothetical protein